MRSNRRSVRSKGLLALFAAILVVLATSPLWTEGPGGGDGADDVIRVPPTAVPVAEEPVAARALARREPVFADPPPLETPDSSGVTRRVRGATGFRGVVVDRGRQPIEGAAVSVGGGETLTDHRGRFELDARVGGGDLVVTKHGYAPFVGAAGAERAAAENGELYVSLRSPAYSIEGRVVDELDRGLPGWNVALIDAQPHPSRRAGTVEGRTGYAPRVTGLDGSFRLEGLGARQYRLRATNDGSGVLESEPVTSGTSGVELSTRWDRIHPGSPIAGRVTDQAGQPVVDAVVRLSDPRRGSRAALRLSTRTDANGEFQVEDAPSRARRLEVSKPGYFPYGTDLRAVATGPLQVRLARGYELQVSPADGTPPASRLYAVDRNGRRLELCTMDALRGVRYVTLQHGHSIGVIVPEGTHSLIVTASNGEQTLLPVELRAGERNVVRY